MSPGNSDYSFEFGEKHQIKNESNENCTHDEARSNLKPTKPTKPVNGSRRGPSPSSTFPAKLHIILALPDLSHIVSWMPHGRAWRVIKPKLFVDTVMTMYFEHQSKYSSFTRQVNGWGFKRITHGPDRNSYYHPLFIRGMPHLARRMTRLSSSASSKSRKEDSTNGNSEPNFYELCRLHPPLPNSIESCSYYNNDTAQTYPHHYHPYYQSQIANYNMSQTIDSSQQFGEQYYPYHYQAGAPAPTHAPSYTYYNSTQSSSTITPHTQSAYSQSNMNQGFQYNNMPYTQSNGYVPDTESDSTRINQTNPTRLPNANMELHLYNGQSNVDVNSDYWQTDHGPSHSNYQYF